MPRERAKKTSPARKATHSRKAAVRAGDKRPTTLRKRATRPAASLDRRRLETEVEGAVPRAKGRLSASDLEEFREILLIKRAHITRDIAALRRLQKNRQESSADLSSVPFHPADAGSDDFEQEFALGLMGNEQGLLREIEEALDRIAKGTFGICVATNKPITKARLQAKPWAKHCIEYARMMENSQVRRV